ncbi:MinD/ParA family protein [Lentibacillus sediminis]|uniref:MinD/ParA family protein n=1 Tax=Lentibacillus sediminis TaxID=1940529 RepID=UPI001EFDD12D|nr:MinD/ParA family protein [Lentibacillus sediminis]
MMHSDQAAELRRRLGKETAVKQARTIAVVSGKGGVGKSSIVINFSLELIKNGKKVLLIDLDVGMGNIDILLGFYASRSFADLFSGDVSMHDIIERGPEGLAYIAGGKGLGSLFSLDEEKRDYFYAEYRELAKQYDYILFDMGAGASEDSIFFILAADECIVVTTPEPTAITDAYSMVKQVVAKEPKMPFHIIMNRASSFKSGSKATERFQKVVLRFLSADVQRMGIIPDDKAVATAVIRQIPFTIMNSKSPASKTMKQLTRDYLMEETETENNASTFLQKLRRFMP